MNDDDLLAALTPEDKEWLLAHGWIPPGDKTIVRVPEMTTRGGSSPAFCLVRLVGDEIESYQRDIHVLPFTLLAHCIRSVDGKRKRIFDNPRHVAKFLPREVAVRLFRAASDLNAGTLGTWGS